MQSTSDRHRHRQQQQHQQQHQTAAVRPHTRLRRSHSPLYNYTAVWAHDLLPRGPHTSPESSTSANPLNPVAVNERMVIGRRRWTRCVCLGFLVCFLVNIASIVFVTVRLSSADELSDNALIEEFLSQAS